MSEDTPIETETPELETDAVEETSDAALEEGSAEDLPDTTAVAAGPEDAVTGDDGDDELAAVVAELGFTRMSLQQLKDTPPADLLALAEKLEVETRTPCASRT